jgi:steroid delta-isomerase
MSREAIEQTLAAYYAALNNLDADAFVAVFAPDAISHDPVGAPPHVGHAGVRGFVNGLVTAFSSVEMTADDTYVCADRAAVKWTVNGVMSDGRAVAFGGIDTFQFNVDGTIRRVWGYWDPSVLAG